MSKIQTGFKKLAGKQLENAIEDIYEALKEMNYKHSAAADICDEIEKNYKKD